MIYKPGSRAYEVVWTTDVLINEFGDCEPDTGVEHVEMFATAERALQRAKVAYPQDFWGSVSITPMRCDHHQFIRGRLTWVACGESEYYDGE